MRPNTLFLILQKSNQSLDGSAEGKGIGPETALQNTTSTSGTQAAGDPPNTDREKSKYAFKTQNKDENQAIPDNDSLSNAFNDGELSTSVITKDPVNPSSSRDIDADFCNVIAADQSKEVTNANETG